MLHAFLLVDWMLRLQAAAGSIQSVYKARFSANRIIILDQSIKPTTLTPPTTKNKL